MHRWVWNKNENKTNNPTGMKIKAVCQEKTFQPIQEKSAEVP